MTSKRVTNEQIQRELGSISASLRALRHDLEELKEIAPRVRSLELFRSYTKGATLVVGALVGFAASMSRSIFGF